eukprot:193450-Pyramimonas_sp.AAC.1
MSNNTTSSITLFYGSGPPVLIAARVHSTPLRNPSRRYIYTNQINQQKKYPLCFVRDRSADARNMWATSHVVGLSLLSGVLSAPLPLLAQEDP